MARRIGSKNKVAAPQSTYLSLSAEERITFLANLIVDRIITDQQSGASLIKTMKKDCYGQRQLFT